jgi:hypothetical protein
VAVDIALLDRNSDWLLFGAYSGDAGVETDEASQEGNGPQQGIRHPNIWRKQNKALCLVLDFSCLETIM